MPYLSLLPIFVFFLIGIALRLAGLASREQAAILFRIVLNVTLPALVFTAVAEAELTGTSLLLPASGFTINGVCTLAAMLYARLAGLGQRQAGALVLGAGITNMLFSFPFVLATLGRAALAEAILYDLGNAVFFATAAYSLALRYGHTEGAKVTATLARTLRAPIFLAIAAGLVVNGLDLAVPQAVNQVLAPLGACTTPLVLMAVGIFFSAAGLFGLLPAVTLLLRMPLGFAAGLAVAWLFGLHGLTAAVVAVAGAAPIGFNSVTLVSMAELDTEQAAAALSISIAVGMVSTTVLLTVAVTWLGGG